MTTDHENGPGRKPAAQRQADEHGDAVDADAAEQSRDHHVADDSARHGPRKGHVQAGRHQADQDDDQGYAPLVLAPALRQDGQSDGRPVHTVLACGSTWRQDDPATTGAVQVCDERGILRGGLLPEGSRGYPPPGATIKGPPRKRRALSFSRNQRLLATVAVDAFSASSFTMRFSKSLNCFLYRSPVEGETKPE